MELEGRRIVVSVLGVRDYVGRCETLYIGMKQSRGRVADWESSRKKCQSRSSGGGLKRSMKTS